MKKSLKTTSGGLGGLAVNVLMSDMKLEVPQDFIYT